MQDQQDGRCLFSLLSSLVQASDHLCIIWKKELVQ